MSRRTLENERGVALPMALAILIILGMVGAAAAFMTIGDTRVSYLYASAHQAAAAAQAGINHAAVVYAEEGGDDPDVWPVTGTVDGYDYSVTATREQYDYDADGMAEDVSMADDGTFNEDGDGHEVWLLSATATRGDVRSDQTLRVASRDLYGEVHSALTANSSMDLRGNITVSGLNHDIDGNVIAPLSTLYTGACDENKPAVRLTDEDDEVDATNAVDMEGNPLFTASDYVEKDDDVKWHSPEGVFGLEDGALDPLVQDASTFAAGDSIDGLVYVNGDYGSKGAGSGTIDGTGILIVHNPLYDPREHDEDHELYDESKAENPRYGPATLGNINGGAFRGIIIADKVDKIDGGVDIYGGVVSLSDIDVTKVGAGTATVNYSCEAIQTAMERSTSVPLRLAWVSD